MRRNTQNAVAFAAVLLTGFTDHSDFEVYRCALHNTTIDLTRLDQYQSGDQATETVRGSFRGNSESADEIVSKYRNVQEPSVPCVH